MLRTALLFLLFNMPFYLFSQSLIVDESLSAEAFELLQDQLQQRYIADLENMSDNGFESSMKARKSADLKGGMMVLSGISCLIVGGVSFYLSEYNYSLYENAEFTHDAIRYRKATQASDFFKLFLTASGTALSGASAAFFTSGPDRGELARMAMTGTLVKEALFVR